MTQPDMIFDKSNPHADGARIQADLDRALGAQLRQIIGLQSAVDIAYDEIARLRDLPPAE